MKLLDSLPYSVWQSHELMARVSRHPTALDLARTLSTQYDTYPDDAMTKVTIGADEVIARYRDGLAIEER